MRCIQVIIDHMDDTLEEAQEYYRDYIIYKDDAPRLATTSLDMAKTHLDLYNKWHSVVVQMISEYKQAKGDSPETMRNLWNYEHEKFTDEYNELKYKIMNA